MYVYSNYNDNTSWFGRLHTHTTKVLNSINIAAGFPRIIALIKDAGNKKYSNHKYITLANIYDIASQLNWFDLHSKLNVVNRRN